MVIYVDILLTGTDNLKTIDFKAKLRKTYAMSDMGLFALLSRHSIS
jgi:hypothetical protein